jgi:hypothetical protein
VSADVIPTADRAERLRWLLAAEIRRVLEDLSARRGLLVEVWGRHRDRAPALDTLASRWMTVGLSDLLALTPAELGPVEAFYRGLSDLRLYLGYTQDMPTAFAERLDADRVGLTAIGVVALEALGDRAPLAPEAPPAAAIARSVVAAAALADGDAPSMAGAERGSTGVWYAPLETAAERTAQENAWMPPSPAALAETEDARAARESWRRTGKVFRVED